jgi:hypothetical protein
VRTALPPLSAWAPCRAGSLGYNVSTLVTLLEDADAEIATLAATQLKHILLVFDAFYDVVPPHQLLLLQPEQPRRDRCGIILRMGWV